MIIDENATGRMSPGSHEQFTGLVWIETLAEERRPSRLRASRVYFNPASRTAWHSHPNGQTLRILAGDARVQSAGGSVRDVGAGTTVVFAPGECHWHGAGPSGPMAHLALQDAADDGVEADWGEFVTDEEYRGIDADSQVVRDDLLVATFGGLIGVDRAHISRLELAPGQSPGQHRHPCDVIGYVLSGTIEFEIAGRPGQRLTVGDAFHEPAGEVINRFDNGSAVQPASFVACYLLPPGESQLIEMV
jgi:quercetin dioxygenase-like cupin family protein